MPEQNDLKMLIELGLDYNEARKMSLAIDKQFKDMERKAQSAAQSVNSSFNSMGARMSKSFEKVDGQIVATIRRIDKLRDSAGKVRLDERSMQLQRTQVGANQYGTTYGVRTVTDSEVTTIREATKATDGFALSTMRLAARAAIVAPLWMAIRGIFQAVGSVTMELIDRNIQLEEGMKEVQITLQETGDAGEVAYTRLKSAAASYFASSTIGMRQITEAMRELGSAGLSAKDIEGGFAPVLDLATASGTDAQQVAATAASIANVFDDQLARFSSKTEKFQYIVGIMAKTWRDAQTSVSEISTAMSYLNGVATSTGINLEILQSAIGAMANAGLRGGKGARNFASGIVEMNKNMDKVRNLGVIFRTDEPLDFVNVLGQIKEKYDEMGASSDRMTKLSGIFGAEGARAVSGVFAQWEMFIKALKLSDEEIKKLPASMRKIYDDTAWRGFLKLWRSWTTDLTNTGGVWNDMWKSASRFFNLLAEQRNKEKQQIIDLANAYSKLGDAKAVAERLSDGEKRELAYALRKTGKNKEAEELERTTRSSRPMSKEDVMSAVAEGDVYSQTLQNGQPRLPQDAYRTTALAKLEQDSRKKDLLDDTSDTRQNFREQMKLVEQKRQARQQERKLVDDATKRELQAIDDQSKASELQLAGLDETEVKYELLINSVKMYNDSVANTAGLTITVNDVLTKNSQALKDANVNIEEQKKLLKDVEEIEESLLKKRIEYSDKLRNTLQTSIKGALSGQGNNVLGDVGNLIKDQYYDSTAKGITNALMSTGIGSIFGDTFLSMEQQIEKAHKTVYGQIVAGHRDGMSGTTTQTAAFGGTTQGGTGLLGGMQTGISNFVNKPLFGYSGSSVPSNLSFTSNKNASFSNTAPYSMTQTANVGGFTGGNALSGIIGGIAGYTSSTNQRKGVRTASAMTGVGTALMSTGNPYAIAAGAILALAGYFVDKKARKKELTVDERYSENRVASKIDVTNKRLELINRNLVALRGTMETFFMPDSAYFAEKRNIEDQFSMSARRG